MAWLGMAAWWRISKPKQIHIQTVSTKNKYKKYQGTTTMSRTNFKPKGRQKKLHEKIMNDPFIFAV